MTAYIITPEQHAQLLKALTTRDLRLHEKCEAMLKAMKPVEPVGYLSRCSRFYKTRMMAVENFEQVAEPVYAKEQQ